MRTQCSRSPDITIILSDREHYCYALEDRDCRTSLRILDRCNEIVDRVRSCTTSAVVRLSGAVADRYVVEGNMIAM